MHICQICKKAPATIHLTDIHNNVKKEVHICESCAAIKGFNLQGAANLPQLLGLAAKKVVASTGAHQPGKPLKTKVIEEDLVCPECGAAWSQFSDRGRLGCPHDYEAFGSRMRNLVAGQVSAHVRNDETLHVGKKPGARNQAEERHNTALRSLEKRLRQAVAEENYETAAKLKSELDDLRTKGPDSGEG